MPGLPEVAESAATGALARTYRDIRAVQGLPLVNLVWRHLATRPLALEWAWAAARPLYVGGTAAAEAQALTTDLEIPVPPAVPAAVLDALGLSTADRRTIAAILAAYNRGNGLNLIALSALLTDPEPDPVAYPPAPDPAPPEPPAELPPVPALDALPGPARALVLALNRFGAGGHEDAVIATLYRHLAPWPAYLALAWSQLAPLAADGRLDALTAETLRAARAAAYRAARGRGPARAPADDDLAFARAAITRFVETAIARMLPIGLLLSRGLGTP